MQFDFPFDLGWGLLFLFILALILAVQVFSVITTRRISPGRKAVRLTLNILFLLVVGLLLLQPFFERGQESQRVLVHDGNYEAEEASRWKDSLGLEESFSATAYLGRGDEVHLLGTDFRPEDLARLRASKVSWAGDFPPSEFIDLHWKGVMRVGEEQVVQGLIHAEGEVELSLHLGAEKIDSLVLKEDENRFRLRSQAKASGRNELTLRLDGVEKGVVRFFAMENKPIHYNLRFTYPDMEIRRLAEWLGRQGQHLSSSIQTSAEARQRARTQDDTVQFYITEPSLVNSPEIRMAREIGATILFTNFEVPNAQLSQINRALGTSFQANRVSQAGNRQIEEGMTALPYQFLARANQWELLDGAVAYQQLGDLKVGVSFLEATFPLAFQGDTLRYGKIWEEIFAALRPVEGIFIDFPQPVFSGQLTSFEINSPDPASNILIQQDTVHLAPTPINPNISKGRWIPGSEGWSSLADSLEVFVYGDNFPYVRQNRFISEFLRLNSKMDVDTPQMTSREEVSPWLMMVLVVFFASLMWLEPRVRKL